MEAHPPGSVTARRACDQPAPEYERARQLLAQGRLHRTLRVLEVANKRCVSSRHHGWATEVEALARVGRHQAARELAQQILHSNGNPLAKKAAHAALDLVKRRTAPARAPQQMLAESQRQLESGQRLLRQAEHLAQRGDAAAAGTLYAKAKAAYEAAWLAQPPNGQGLFLAGHCALKQGRAVEAQRLFDRALLELERDAGKPVKLHTRRNQVEKYISSTKLIAWSARDDQLAVAEKNLVQLVSPDKPGRLSLLTAARVRDLLFTSDGSFIVTASDGGQLELWSALDGTLLWSTLTRRSPIAGVALTPDGRGILIASVDGRVQIRNVLDETNCQASEKTLPKRGALEAAW